MTWLFWILVCAIINWAVTYMRMLQERRRADEYKALYLRMIGTVREFAQEQYELKRLNVQLSERVAAQSELLTRVAWRAPSRN